MMNDHSYSRKIKVVVVEPLVYFAFLFFNETVITRAQGPVVAIAKKERNI